ncbi:MAG: radical SAM family heme chaperone HemW [Bacteroidia bacterium]
MFPHWIEEASLAKVKTLGLYIHVPFCRRACHYCDFYFTPRASLMEDYVEALLREIEAYRDILGAFPIQTVFLGGGTPSWLPQQLLGRIFQRLATFSTFSPTEVTLEANPEDIYPDNLRFWHGLGVTRISVGIQSFSAQVLFSLGRFHDPNTARQAVEYLSESEIPSWNADLIFAVPGQTVESFLEDIDFLIKKRVPHLSLYGLTIEEHTVFYKKLQLGRINLVDEEIYATAYLRAHEFLANAGLIWYEISNWAQPNHECRHNWRYWRREPYIGLGPSAHSYIPEVRWANSRSLRTYISDWANNTYSIEMVERLSPQDVLTELWITKFRTRIGIAWSDLQGLSDRVIRKLKVAVAQAKDKGWLYETDTGFRLSPRGALFSDELASRFSVITETALAYH